MNPNYVPWMSILGLLGLGIGFLAGGMRTDQQGMIPALYGFVAGIFTGVALRLVLRWLWKNKQKSPD